MIHLNVERFVTKILCFQAGEMFCWDFAMLLRKKIWHKISLAPESFHDCNFG